jgi:ADP-ribosyl-[dinitrogen reductase] hydrolase
LDLDLDIISAWGAKAVLTLIEDHEFETLGVQDLPPKVLSRGMEWFHLPIEDGSIPDTRFTELLSQIRGKLIQMLEFGNNVLIHCRGGIGRSGLVSAFLLRDRGMSVDKAIEAVRLARPGAVETFEQEEYVRGYYAIYTTI